MDNSLRHKDLVHVSFNGEFNTLLGFNDFLRDSERLPIGGEAVHYIGFSKPFQHLYAETIESGSQGELTIEYFDGTDWVAVPNLYEDTRGLNRSGFIRWEFLESENIRDFWKLTTVNNLELFWIRISSVVPLVGETVVKTLTNTTESMLFVESVEGFKVGQTISIEGSSEYSEISIIDETNNIIELVEPLSFIPALNTTISLPPELAGINIVFCDEIDLEGVNPRIKQFLFKGQRSFINYQVEARKKIVQTLRNGGWSKMFKGESQVRPLVSARSQQILRTINKWDVLDFSEVREAAKFLTLSYIFFEVSENNEDKSYMKYRDYKSKYSEAFKVFFLALDLDDDGEIDRSEERNDSSIEILRV